MSTALTATGTILGLLALRGVVRTGITVVKGVLLMLVVLAAVTAFMVVKGLSELPQ